MDYSSLSEEFQFDDDVDDDYVCLNISFISLCRSHIKEHQMVFRCWLVRNCSADDDDAGGFYDEDDEHDEENDADD